MPNRQVLATEFEALLHEIRCLPGFGAFAAPETPEHLQADAAAGTIVVFNISSYRSDALLVDAASINSVPLLELKPGALTDRISAFYDALRMERGPGADMAVRQTARRTMLEILGWLWDVAAEPVLEALGYQGTAPTDAPWPRVWWIPGGLLGLLPIHAAGHHADPAIDGGPKRAVLDRVVYFTPLRSPPCGTRGNRFAMMARPTGF